MSADKIKEIVKW